MKTHSRWIVGGLIFYVLALTPTFAERFTEMSLEELLQVEVVPVNVLTRHTHFRGEAMIGYRVALARSEGNRDGTRDVTVAEVLDDFAVVPTEMTVTSHIVELMYALTDRLIVMATLPLREYSMSHVTRAGQTFSTEALEIGDARLAAQYELFGVPEQDVNRLLVEFGFILPTGSIDGATETPAGHDRPLPYPMRSGGGVLAVSPGVTYLGNATDWAWGSYVTTTLPIGKNSRGYRPGSMFRWDMWLMRRITDWLAPSVRTEYRVWGNIVGRDAVLDPTSAPTADPDRRGGSRLEIAFGLNLRANRGILEGHRITVEAGWPIVQSLRGPQLKETHRWTLGWQYTRSL